MDTEGILAFVKEAVEDEQKLVTYKWLSVTKNISMNQAKEVLQEFVKSNRCSGLTVHLCLIGYKNCDKQKTLNVKIVKADEERNSSKDYVEWSSHVYSVQKTNSDSSLLYSCDYDVCKQLQFENRNLLGIKCDHVVVRSRKKCAEPPANSIPQTMQKKNPPISVDPKKSKPVSSLSSFMQNKMKLQSNSSSDNSDSGFASAKHSIEDKKPANVSIFNNHNKAKGSQVTQKSQSNEEIKPSESQPEQTASSQSRKSHPAPKASKTSSGTTKPPQKGKRKRIEEISSSSDESSAEENCNLFDSSPPQTQLGSRLSPDEKSKINRPASCDVQEAKENTNLNCMKKVLAVKTYMDSDDEGFMTTEKVVEIVQVPIKQSEMKIEKKVVPNKQEAMKKAPASKKKQAVTDAKQSTISSFFTRK